MSLNSRNPVAKAFGDPRPTRREVVKSLKAQKDRSFSAPASATVGLERKPDTIIEPKFDSNADLHVDLNEHRTSGSVDLRTETHTEPFSQADSIRSAR